MNPYPMFRRRDFLMTMSALPWLPGLLQGAPLLRKSNRSLIVLWMDGGMSHIDTSAGKPEARPDIRGAPVARESSLEGVFVSEHLPRISGIMDQCALVRSITSTEGNHGRGSHYMLTGRRPSPLLEYPSIGSVLTPEQLGNGNPIPSYVAIPDAHPYAKQGFLPLTRGPFEVGGDPSKGDFRVRNMAASPQAQRALSLLQTVDALDGKPRSESEQARDRFLSQARFMSLSPEARELFDLSSEKPETRKRYGRKLLGQSALLARRLVEGGVRTVLVRYKGWDHHQGIARALTYGFPPKLEALDQAVSALHEDLTQRGLDDRVTVLLASEFGRTPRINPRGGRDHWGRASSALLFGGGLKRGVVVGKTDANGEALVERPVTPADLFSTVLAALGADLEHVLHTPDGRPSRIVVESAKPVHEILQG